MYEIKNHPVNPDYAKNANITQEQYQRWYKESIEQPEQFWAARATEFLTWFKPWSKVKEADFKKGQATWFKDAKLNVSSAQPFEFEVTAGIWDFTIQAVPNNQ